MKKSLILGLALLISFGLANNSFAATTATVDIQVTIVSGVVSINNTGDATVSFDAANPQILFNQTGYLTFNGAGIGRAIFTNSSADTVADWSVSGTDFDTNFTLGSAPSATAGVLYGIWTEWNRDPIVASDFGADDVITTAVAPSSSTAYAFDGEPAGDVVRGMDVPAGADRSMYFRLDTPTSGTAGTFTSTVTVTAAVSM